MTVPNNYTHWTSPLDFKALWVSLPSLF